MDIAHDAHALDPSVESFIAAKERPRGGVRLAARLGSGFLADGLVYLDITTPSGTSGFFLNKDVSLAEAVAACDAFMAVLATGRVPEPEDPVAARRLRHAKAAAIGDTVREMVLESGL